MVSDLKKIKKEIIKSQIYAISESNNSIALEAKKPKYGDTITGIIES